MIVLSSYSTSWCQNDISSKGVAEQNDSLVLVPVSALRIANMKMTELKYEKEINDSLRSIIKNDDKIIATYKSEATTFNKKIKKSKTQRNAAFCVSGSLFVLLIISLF